MRLLHPKTPKSLRSQLDDYFAENPDAKVVVLLVLTCFVTAAGTAGLVAVSGNSVYDEAWTTLAGIGLDWTFAGDERSLLERVVALVITCGGLFITALLIGLVSDTISTKLDELRQGLSPLQESEHVLVLGWSDLVLPLVNHLGLARPQGITIVVLADREKEEMDAEVQAMEFEGNGLPPRVLCRRGNPVLKTDLLRASADHAAAIVLLKDADAREHQEVHALMQLDALRRQNDSMGHAVIDSSGDANSELLRAVGGADSTHVVKGLDAVGIIMLLGARRPGLSAVFDELLGFDGSEFHEHTWAAMDGRFFGSLLTGAFKDAVPVGLRRADGSVVLNPPADTVCAPGDALIVLAEEDDSAVPATDEAAYAASDPLTPARSSQRSSTQRAKVAEQVLIVGWRRDMPSLVAHLDELLFPGSRLTILSARGEAERQALLAGIKRDNVMVSQIEGDAASRADLEKLPLEDYDSILLLADDAADKCSSLETDSRTLTSLMLIRDIQTARLLKLGTQQRAPEGADEAAKAVAAPTGAFGLACAHCDVVVEVLDTRTRPLIAGASVADCIMTTELVAKMLAAVALDPGMLGILEQLLAPEGMELCLLPASSFPTEEAASFWQLSAVARSRFELLIGWRLAGQEGVVLNPEDKGERREWHEGDMLILLRRTERKKRQLKRPNMFFRQDA